MSTFILNQNIDVVINCAAFTEVDQAEENSEIAEGRFFNSEEEMNYLDNIEDSIESIRGEPTEEEYTTNMIIELK